MVAVQVPVTLPLSAADYTAAFGTAATVFLEYGTATTPTDGTATTPIAAGLERYEFVLPSVTSAHYYRWRVGDAAAGTATAYSPTFQMPLAYATMEELTSGMDLPDESRYDELDRLLVDATDYLTTYVTGGRRFFREPVGSGTTTLSLDVPIAGQDVLSVARGRELDVISLSSVGVAAYTGAAYDSLASGATGYYLLPDHPAPGRPFTDVALSDQGATHARFPTGYRVVQLVGAFGWAAVPDLVRRATVDLARAWWHRQPGEADPVGISAFGSPVFGPGTPKTVRDLRNSAYAWRRFV